MFIYNYMILTKNVNIVINGANRKGFYKKGYENLEIGENKEICVMDLPKSSLLEIEVKCDYCEKIVNVKFSNYYKNTKNNMRKYACSIKCGQEKVRETNLERYGVEYSSQNENIKNKIKETNIERYGVENTFQYKDFIEKSKKTNLDRYGVEHVTQNIEIYNKIRETNIERYGVEYSSQNQDIKNKRKETSLKNDQILISEKRKLTNNERYGFDCNFVSDDFKINSKKTMIERYGVEHPIHSEDIRNKIIETNNILFGTDYYSQSNVAKGININQAKIKYENLIFIEDKNNSKFIIKCDNSCEHEFEINNVLLSKRYLNKNIICTICNDPTEKGKSYKENEIYEFVKNIYSDAIQNYILEYREIDIYIPSLKFGIEFNGLYWHSELHKDKNYHLDKTNHFKKYDINILHIWEDEWLYKEDIVKSIISNRIGKTENKIFARKSIIQEVKDTKLVRQFLDTNHIQGYCSSSIKLGLYYNNELVSLMTFGYRNTNSKKEFELIRFCNILNTNVVGGANKLFNYFLTNFEYDDIISYSDNRIFDGGLYKKLKFEYKHLSSPEYYWVKDDVRYNRFKFNKKQLIKEGFDKDKTEVEIMHERKYYRIFGCGQMKWVYNKKERLYDIR